MKNLFLLNRSGMSPEVTTCRKGRHAIESIVSRISLASLICVLMLTIGSGNAWGAEKEWDFSTDGLSSKTPITLTYGIGEASNNTTVSSGTLRLYAKRSNGKGSWIKFEAASGYEITAVSVTATANQSYARYAVDPASMTGAFSNSFTFVSGTATVSSLHATSFAIRNGQNSGSQNKTIQISSITITYAATASYTVSWSINPAAGGTLSATSGNSTTVTPDSEYEYDSPAYTVTSGTATVSQSTNTFTATPSSNCAICINMVEKPKYTITYNAGSGTCGTASWTQPSAGDATTLPSATTSCTGWSFAGWCTSSAGSADENSSSPGTILTGSYTPTSNVTLYAVYTRSVSGGGTSYVSVDASGVTEGTYVIAALKSSSASSNYYPATGSVSSGDMTVGSTAFTLTAGAFSEIPTGGIEFTFTGNNTDGFSINNGSGNLYFTTSSNRNLAFQANNTTKWKVYNHDNPLNTNGVYLQYYDGSSSYYTISENSTGDGAIRGYASNTKYRAIYLFKKTGGSTTYYMTNMTCADSYTLTFKEWDGGGAASGSPSTGTVTANATSFSFGATPPSKSGYQIEGFYTNKSGSGGVKVADGSRNFIASVTDWTNSSSEYTKGSNATLYIKWEAQHYTITYDKGEYGTGDAIAAGDKTHGVSFTLSSSTFTRDGYTQDGWSTSDGGEKVYDLGGSYTTNADITLYPHWVINNYTVSWSVNGSNWTSGVTASNNNANHGSTVSAPTAPTSSDCDDSKVFVGWTNDEYSDPSSAPGVLFTSTSPAITANTTFYAVFATQSGSSTDWELVTSSSDALADGDDIIIASSGSAGSAYALGYQKSNNRDAVSVTIASGPKISSPTLATTSSNTTDIYPLRLEANGSYFNIKDVLNNKYLGATGTSNNLLKLGDDKNSNTRKFAISVNASGVASIVGQDASTHRYMRVNTSDKLFTCYETSSSQSPVYIYRKSVAYADYTTSCCNQPLTQLSIEADKTELVRTGAVEFTLTGGNGQNITWSCRDEADANCDALLTSTSNSGATLTISSPVATTKTYVVKAVQPEDDDDPEHIVCGKTVSIEITVKAQWTITFKTTDDGVLTTSSTTTVTDGESYTFPDLSDEYTCGSHYSFAGWKATNADGAPEYAAGSSATAVADKIWYAVWMYSADSEEETRDKYERVTSSSTAIDANDIVVIANADNGVALGQMTTSSTEGGAVAVDFAADKSYLTFAAGTTVMPLKIQNYADEGADSFYFVDNAETDNAITIASESPTGKLHYAEPDDGDLVFWTWKITITAQNNAVIEDYVDNDYAIQYNSSRGCFAYYKKTQKVVQLYRKNGTIKIDVPSDPTYSMNNTHCTNGATIRANSDQWVTSSKDQKVRITIPVTAKNFTTSGKQLSATSDNAHFAASFPTHTIPGDKSEVIVNMVVEYTPEAANTIEDANITITTGTGDGNATRVINVNGRSLPDEFVIVTYKDSKWQALPADMFNGSGTYTPEIVTPNAGPTKVPAAPYTTIYSARGVATSRYEAAGNCVRLVGNNNKCLWANSTSNSSHIQNWAALGSTNGSQYEWLLTTTDGEQYTIANPAHPDYATGRQLAINTLYYGLYKTDAIFYLLPVDCSTQPGNLQITPRRVDATFSWETNASTVTIDLYTNEGMTEGHKTASVTDVPYQFSSLAESTQYWYKLTPDADDDCAVTGTFKTTGPVIDVVEWQENAAVIFVDKDEAVNPRVVIDGEVEHGQGGTMATDIFFSKYFEAEGTAKLLAIYNGTGNAISLSDITILQRTSAKNTPLSLASYGKTAGWIQPGEEIVLFNQDARPAVMECAESNDTYDSWINVEDNNLAFSGKGTVRLFRGNTCIDIIGAMAAGDNAANMNDKTRDPMEGAGTPSFGDANGFVTLYGDNYETPAEETDYELSTNRCLLIRRAFVTSGDSALLNNFGDFKTLGTYTGVDSKTHKGEWSGLQIPNADKTAVPPEADYIHTCQGFEDVGSFDYNKYYKDYTNISNDKLLDQFTRNADGTYVITLDYMRQYACLNLKFQLTDPTPDPDDEETVLTEQTVQVPIVVTDARNTNDSLFNFLIRKDDGTEEPMISASIDRCKTCNVVVLGTGTLTKVTDGTTASVKDKVTGQTFTTQDVAELRDVKVYPGGKLIIPSGTHYVVNSLALRRQEDVVAAAKINSGLADDPDNPSDKGVYVRVSNGVYLDIRIDPSNWHYFTLPYDCRVGDVRFSDGTPAKVNTDYLISWYDGAYRAEHKDGGWTDITNDDYVLKAGLGYIVALPGSGPVKRELRFPMAKDVIDEELGDKTVEGLYAYGGDKTDEELRPNHKGWNMIGNPYLFDYTTDIVTDPLATGELVHDPAVASWNGKWVRTGSARYIVAPIDNGWSGYEQTTISNLRPFMSYFIQVGTKTDGTENPETERSILFRQSQKPASIIRRAQAEEAEPMYPVWYGLELYAPNGEKDQTTLLISDEFTDDYDMMDDLVKMRGSYYNYYPYPVLASRNNEGEMAFNALPDSSAAVIGVPLNYYAYQAGTYTFVTDSRYDLEEVKSAMLFDATTQQYYDLLTENHSFSLAKGDNNARFKLYVRVERKKAPEVATDVDNVLDGRLSLVAIDKTLVLSGLTDAAHIYVYDMSGKLIKGEHTSGNNIWRATVPAQGVYFVRVNSAEGQQTLRTIVK